MKMLTEYESRNLLKKYKIDLPRVKLVKTEKEAINYSYILGFPLVLKISSPDIIHKTEANCVITGVKNAFEVKEGFVHLLKNAKEYNPKARIDGVLVEEMLKGKETIVGSTIDSQFGPVILFGIGGIFVEIFKDISFRVLPITRKDAAKMITEIKGYAVLKGERGEKPVNFTAIEDTLLAVSKLMCRNKKIKELDINPLFVNEKTALAGDIRIVLNR